MPARGPSSLAPWLWLNFWACVGPGAPVAVADPSASCDLAVTCGLAPFAPEAISSSSEPPCWGSEAAAAAASDNWGLGKCCRL